MKIAIALVFITCMMRLQAQNNEGYVVLQNKDTLRGTIKVAPAGDDPVVSLNGTSYQGMEVTSFYEASKDLLYVRKFLEIDAQGNPSAARFLQEIVTGPMRMYQLPERRKKFSFTFFIESNEQPLTELTDQYKGQLSYLLRACDDVQSNIMELEELNTFDLEYLISKYNKCLGYESPQKNRDGRKTKIAFGPLIGVSTIDASLNNAFIESPLGAPGILERAVLLRPVYGLDIQIRPPLDNGINFNVKYFRRSFNESYRFLGTIDMLTFDTKIEESWNQDLFYGSIQYRLNHSYRSFFIEVGVGMAITRFESSFNRQQDLNGNLFTFDGDISDQQSTLAIFPGIGYHWNDLKVGAYVELTSAGGSPIIGESAIIGLQLTYFLLKTR